MDRVVAYIPRVSSTTLPPARSLLLLTLLVAMTGANSVHALENCTATFKKYFPKDCVDAPLPRPAPNKPSALPSRLPPASSSSGGHMSGDSYTRPMPSAPSYTAPSVSSGNSVSDVLDVLTTAIELYQLVNKQPEPIVHEESETADEMLERLRAEEAAREREEAGERAEAEERAEAARLRERKRSEAAVARPSRHEDAAYDPDDPFAPIDKEQAKTLRDELKNKFKDIGKEMVSFWDRAKDKWDHLTFRKDFNKKYLDKIENLADRAWDQD